MEELIVNFFQQLFKSAQDLMPVDFLYDIDDKVSDEINSDQPKDFTTTKIEVALKQIHPTKVSGLE